MCVYIVQCIGPPGYVGDVGQRGFTGSTGRRGLTGASGLPGIHGSSNRFHLSLIFFCHTYLVFDDYVFTI